MYSRYDRPKPASLPHEACALVRSVLWGSRFFRESYLMVRDVAGML